MGESRQAVIETTDDEIMRANSELPLSILQRNCDKEPSCCRQYLRSVEDRWQPKKEKKPVSAKAEQRAHEVSSSVNVYLH